MNKNNEHGRKCADGTVTSILFSFTAQTTLILILSVRAPITHWPLQELNERLGKYFLGKY